MFLLGTQKSDLQSQGRDSAAGQGRGKELTVGAGLCPSGVSPTSPAAAIRAKGYREAAGHQPGDQGLTVGAGGLLLVGGSRTLLMFVREEAQGHLASCC